MICAKLQTHLQRCFMWRLKLVEPTSHELKLLGEADIHDPTLRSYIVWRRLQIPRPMSTNLVEAPKGCVGLFISLSATEIRKCCLFETAQGHFYRGQAAKQ